MTPLLVRFCVGCGYVRDEICQEPSSAQWMDGQTFVTAHGVCWEELIRIDDACPPCARVFAIARRGTIEPSLPAEVI